MRSARPRRTTKRRRPARHWTRPSTCPGCCCRPRRRSTSSPRQVRIAAAAGACGFMAGRAIWGDGVGRHDAATRAAGVATACARLDQLAGCCASTAAAGGRRRPVADGRRAAAGRLARDLSAMTVWVVAGPAGSGKSTLGRALATATWRRAARPRHGHQPAARRAGSGPGRRSLERPATAATPAAGPLRDPAGRRRRPGRRRDRAGRAVHGRAPRRPRVVARCWRRWLRPMPRVVWLDGSPALYEERRRREGRAARPLSGRAAGRAPRSPTSGSTRPHRPAPSSPPLLG